MKRPASDHKRSTPRGRQLGGGAKELRLANAGRDSQSARLSMADWIALIPAPIHMLLDQGGQYAAAYTLDLDGRVTSWNSRAMEVEGFPADEILGRSMSCFYTPAQCAARDPEAALMIAAESGRFSDEVWRLRRDGTAFRALTIVEPVYRQGEPVGFVTFIRDLTRSPEAPATVGEADHRFRRMVQGVIDYAISTLDPMGIITSWNAGAERITGYPATQVIGRPAAMLFTEDDRDHDIPARVLTVARRDGRYETETWRCRRDGSRFRANVVIDTVREGEKLIGFAEITRDLSAQGADREPAAMDRTRWPLDLSRPMVPAEAPGPATDAGAGPVLVDLNERLGYICEMLAFTFDSTVQLEVDLAPSPWPVTADPVQLQLAIFNLAVHARDTIRPGSGQVRLRTRNVTLAQNLDRRGGDFVSIDVEDSGPGLPPVVLNHLFEPLLSWRGPDKGTGFGLGQVCSFARRSGGDVSVTSKPDHGSIVSIHLPRAVTSTSQANAA